MATRSSIEIARPPQQVFSYIIDPSRQGEWQEGVNSARLESGGPPAVGSKVVAVRRIGPMEHPVAMEMTELDPPRSWELRGIDGSVRGLIVRGTVEALHDGARACVTIELDFDGHRLGKLLMPLVARQAQAELPKSLRRLKEQLETVAADMSLDSSSPPPAGSPP